MKLDELKKQLEILHKISHLLTVKPDLAEALRIILEKIGRRMEVTQLAVWLVDEEGYFYIAAHYNISQKYIEFSKSKEGRVMKTKGAIGKVFATKKPYLCKNLEDLSAPKKYIQEIKREKIKIAAILCVPLMVRGESIGVLNFYFPKPRKIIPKTEVNLVSIIANQIAGVVENSRIYQNLEKKTEKLEDAKRALTNMLEDVEDARKTSEEEKNKTLTIISNLADGLLVFDKNNSLSLINLQAENFFSVKTKEIMGNSVLELVKFPNLRTLVNLLGMEIKGIFRKELVIGENLTVEVSTVPMILGEEKLGALVILHDITREKMTERIKTEFVSLAAHQLRTPLSAIKWTLDMLLDGDLGEITKEQRDFIGKTYQSNERMITLINDLLDVTRIEEGKYLYQPTLTDIGSIVQFVVNSYKEEVQRKKLNLEFKKPMFQLPKIVLDVEKIRLVVQNLLENAIKYTLSGGKITVSLKHLKEKKEIELQVQDTGVGIPKDQQERVFTKFFRAANIIRLDTEGSGLGLFISKNIIEAHGGRIRFESEEGKGATFYLNLPIKEEFVEFLKEF